MNINVVIADDENLIRNLFVSALSKYGDIIICGLAANGEEVIAKLKDSRPDVLILDLNMPRLSGIEVLNQLSKESIHVNTLVISMQDSDSIIWEAINAGALGFLEKNGEWDELYTAIKTVAKGEFYYTKRINSILLDVARNKNIAHTKGKSEFNEREITIIHLLNDGFSSSEIAEKIYSSRSTVNRIRQELIHRVGARNTTGLVAFAIRHKLIELSNK